MAAYITQQFADGKAPDEIFRYLSRGKFDPHNPEHVKRLEAATSQTALEQDE
jgi:hypothetical protein